MVDMEKLARVWRKMQDKRDEMRHAWEQADEAIEAQQKVVGAALLEAMTGLKADKLTTQAGVVERKEEYKVSGADWQAIYKFVVEHDAFEMLHKRLSSTFVEKWAKEHGAVPPGVNTFRQFVVAVKKPTARAVPASD